MPIEELCHIDYKPLLNGMFSVGKGEFKDGAGNSEADYEPDPGECSMQTLAGDIGTLPGIAGTVAVPPQCGGGSFA